MRRTIACAAMAAAVAWLLALGACDKGGFYEASFADGEIAPDVAADAGVDADVATDAVDAATDNGDAATEQGSSADAPMSDAMAQVPYIPSESFRFEMAGRDGDSYLVRVVARAFPAIYGIALRVEFDPSAIAFESAAAEPLFGSDGTDAAYKAAVVRPGSVTLAMTHVGYPFERTLDGDVTLTTLRLKALKAAPTTLSFFAPRCLVLTEALAKVDATYLAATLYP